MQTLLDDRRLLLPVIATAIAIALGSVLIVVLSDDAASGAGAASAASTPASGAQTIEIADFKFQPATLTVAAGTKVTWVNRDTAPHTATAKDGFDTGNLRKGDTKTLTLKTAGTFAYVCEFHPFMTATVVVE